MVLAKWEDLPASVKRSRKNLYKYLKAEIEGVETDIDNLEKRNIKFTVTDGTNALQGAVVTIGTITGTTGSSGGCTLKAVTDGKHTVTVTCDGYADYSAEITTDTSNDTFEITMEYPIYDFTSYGDSGKEEELATGTAQPTGTVSGDYSQIKVLTNTTNPEEWVGLKFYILSAAEADGETAYQLYSDAGTTGTGMYVTISEHEDAA